MKDHLLQILKPKNKAEIDSAIQKKFQNSTLDEILQYAVNHNNLYLVQYALAQGANPAYKDNWPIEWAAYHGNIEIVKLLLVDPRVDPSTSDNFAIRWAAFNDHTEVVKLLLADSRVDPSADDYFAIQRAAKNGRAEVLKLLLTDPRVLKKLTAKQKEKYSKYLNENF